MIGQNGENKFSQFDVLWKSLPLTFLEPYFFTFSKVIKFLVSPPQDQYCRDSEKLGRGWGEQFFKNSYFLGNRLFLAICWAGSLLIDY